MGTSIVPTIAPLASTMAFLSSEHEVHRAWAVHWNRLERAMKGGVHILPALRPFDWEKPDGDALKHRREWATYINFPDFYLSSMIGLISKKMPAPDQGLSFGSLGKVSIETERPNYAQTRADLAYYNCDGVGNDGAQWDAWWATRAKRARGLGHVWIMEESAPAFTVPTQRSFRTEIRGERPYLVEFGPGQVWDWHFENGRLQYAIVRLNHRKPFFNGQRFTSENETHYLLLTRKGWDGFGSEYTGGGFWRYDSKGELYNNSKGNWDRLDGAIPFHILYGERDEQGGTLELPSISRPDIMELSAMAIGYMNLASAADFEAWDSAKGMEWIIGAHQDAFNLAMHQITGGSRFVAVPTIEGALDPRIQSSNTGTIPAEVFGSRFEQKHHEAQLFGLLSETSTPDASGLSKAVGFAETKAPRLASLASEIETAQNTAILNLELRWGVGSPSGFTRIPRDFDLLEIADSLERVFQISTENQIRSATFKSRAFRRLISEQGVETDAKVLDKIEKEVLASAQNEEAALERDRELDNAIPTGA